MITLPAPIYESMPSAYVMAGSFALGTAEQVAAFISGVAFTIAGITAFNRRIKNRQKRSLWEKVHGPR